MFFQTLFTLLISRRMLSTANVMFSTLLYRLVSKASGNLFIEKIEVTPKSYASSIPLSAPPAITDTGTL